MMPELSALMKLGLVSGPASASGGSVAVFSGTSGRSIDDVTFAQLTQSLDIFTTTLQGVVPGSGGGTTKFLRADGTWATLPLL